MNNCLFCKFLNDPSFSKFLIYEDADFIAFPDISQFTQGHTLVIPKKHYRWVYDLKTDKNATPNLGRYFEVCQKIIEKMKKELHCEQVFILTMGSMIPHAHIHLIPKTSGNWNQVLEKISELQKSRVSEETMIKITDKLKT